MSSNPFPNLYLVGAPKAGTSFLHAHLADQAEIFGSGYKEPSYFHYFGAKSAQWGRASMPVMVEQTSEAAYLSLFAEWRDEPYAIDASTNYLQGPDVCSRIKAARPDAKIIAVVREPVARAYSYYLMKWRDGWVREPFADAIENEKVEAEVATFPTAFHYGFVSQSTYAPALRAYVEAFGSDQVRVYRFEDVTQNISAVLCDLSDFLGFEIKESQQAAKEKNSFKVERSPILTKILLTYHRLPLKHLVNRVVPRATRDKIRIGYRNIRNKDGEKPKLDPAAEQKLLALLGTDYTDALTYTREQGVLFELE